MTEMRARPDIQLRLDRCRPQSGPAGAGVNSLVVTHCGRLDSAQLPYYSPSQDRRPATTSVKDHVVKPIMNLDEVEFDDVEENGVYTSSRGQISDHIGAKKLGYNLTVLPPGKVQCPFHCHHGEEEMFLILEGEGELRFGDKRYPIRKHDVIACPPGGPEVAHQIINTGATTMRYLALSTLVDVETCEYPDSQKILVVTGQRGERGLRKMFRAENTVDYYDREKS
jgi:uncharacterized cupin superfamily protein